MAALNKWHNVVNEGDINPTYTRDTWVIPEGGTDIWCTGWKRGQTIKPYGDGCHVVVGLTVYHCDELMGIMENWSKDGYTWGLDGVKPTREQQIGGYWQRVNYPSEPVESKETIFNAGSKWEVIDRAGNNLLLRRESDGEYAIAHGWKGEEKGWDQGKYFGTGKESASKAKKVFEEYKAPDSFGYK